MIYVRRLVWDAWNVAHIARHEVSPEEVDELCQRDPIVDQTYGGRLRLVGRTRAGRMLTVILAPEDDAGAFYTVTARPASRKERRKYRERKGGELK